MSAEQLSKKKGAADRDVQVDDNFDLGALLHPARAFAHPMDVVRDPDLTLNEKRAILASWASDACSVEAAPDLRLTTLGGLVRWDDIMDALRMLDHESGNPSPRYKQVAKKEAGSCSHGSDGAASLH